MTEPTPNPQPDPTPEEPTLAEQIAEGVAAGVAQSVFGGTSSPTVLEEPAPLVSWKVGDKVRNLDGIKLVVISQSEPGSAVHCESIEGVDPYVNTWFGPDTLKKGH